VESVASNIGPRERRKRRVMGFVALAAGAGLALALVATDAPRLLRLLIFFPVWIAALGFFQAREKTCIALAARGTCIKDAALVAKLRALARVIHRRALITATIITAVALAFPG
jgi:hypothetical protein